MEEKENFFMEYYNDLKGMPVEGLYYLVNANTDYVNNYKLEDIEDIRISLLGDIFILLKNGELYKNGDLESIGIRRLDASCRYYDICAISYSNNVYIPTLEDDSFINRNDCIYKTIIIGPNYITALTYDKKLIIAGEFIGVIDSSKFENVDNIGYIDKEVVIIKGKKAFNLFKDDTVYSSTDPRICIVDKFYEYDKEKIDKCG